MAEKQEVKTEAKAEAKVEKEAEAPVFVADGIRQLAELKDEIDTAIGFARAIATGAAEVQREASSDTGRYMRSVGAAGDAQFGELAAEIQLALTALKVDAQKTRDLINKFHNTPTTVSYRPPA